MKGRIHLSIPEGDKDVRPKEPEKPKEEKKKTPSPQRMNFDLSEQEVEELPPYEKNIYMTRKAIMEIQKTVEKPNLNNHAKAMNVNKLQNKKTFSNLR